MGIHVNKWGPLKDPNSGSEPATLSITLTEESNCKSITSFTTAINRALNCWPDAPPELKELGDMLNHGKILQDYYHQSTSKK